MYFYHFNLIDYLIIKLISSVPSWEAVTAITAIVIGISAWRISQKQSEILERQVKLEDYAEIFIRPCKSNDGWELQIRNACPRVVYIISSRLEGDTNSKAFGNLRFSRGEPATLPVSAGEYEYYRMLIPPLEKIEKDNEGVPTFHLHIRYKDILGKQKESHHAGWFQNNSWVVHNLESTILNQDGSKVSQN